MDKINKFRKYQEAGVKEYWIVEPDQRLVTVFRLDSNHKFHFIETFDEGRLEIQILPGLFIDLNLVFPQINDLE